MDIYTIANQMKMEHKTINDLSIRVTFYARVSTMREEQENSIEHQIQYFTELIQDNPNWIFVPGYVDRIRGESAANRTSFLQMIEDGKSGKFDLILTKEVSRFARNTIDSLTYTRELLRAGVGVYFQNDGICTIDTDSELRLTIMSSIAADEVRKLSERVHWGHKRSIESGHVLGNNRIFGYDKVNCKLVINEQEADMVRLIFETYATGQYSVRKIENMLYEKGYRGRNGTRIHHNTISGIIQNPKYKGYYCGNKVRITDYRTKEQKFLPKDEWITYKDESGEVVPAIVSEELWQKCNDIFKERSDVVKSHGRSFKDKSVFTGKIWCRSHEKPYWRTSYSNSASTGKPVYQWICSEKKRFGTKHCSSIAIMEWELYSLLGDFFQNVSGNITEYVETFLRIYQETGGTADMQKRLEQLQSQLDRTRLKKDKLLELYMDDAITKTEFKSRNDGLSEEIASIQSDMQQVQTEQLQKHDYAKSVKEIEQYLKEMYNPDTEMTKHQIDEMVDAIVDRIDVVPVNQTEMKLIVKLKTGQSTPVHYIRTGQRYGRRSGIMVNIMIPERQYSFSRKSFKKARRTVQITYVISLGI